jgi:hypothetical protein
VTWLHRSRATTTGPPPTLALPCPPVKRVSSYRCRASLSFLSPSPHFPLRVKHATAPYSSPHCLLSEPVTIASPKPSIDIIHLPPRSLRRRVAPVDLRCRLHFDEHRAGALLLLDLQVDASELSFGRTLESPFALTAPQASKKHRRVTPSATSSAHDHPW